MNFFAGPLQVQAALDAALQDEGDIQLDASDKKFIKQKPR